MLRQYIPIRYTDNPDEINESGIGTLLKIAEDNNTTVSAILKVNPSIKSADKIRQG